MKTNTNTAEKNTQESTPKVGTSRLIGFDLGTNTSCLRVANTTSREVTQRLHLPTIVGYAGEGILEDIIPENETMLFGEDALKFQMHLELTKPLSLGVIENDKAAADFCRHLGKLLETETGGECRAVIGVPARTDAQARERVRNAVKGVFDKVILIPEPFLAALGFRDENALKTTDYIDPVKNSLFIDIGAGSSDLCLVQGYYPGSEDTTCIQFAGDSVDELLQEKILLKYPDAKLPLSSVKKFKESYSYVGDIDRDIQVKTIVGGKPRQLEIGKEVRESCETLLEYIFQATCHLIAMADPDSVPELLQNIVVTGGGSLIEGLGAKLQTLLEEDGFENPRVSVLGENYKEYVASGALKAAFAARDHQWQNLL